MVTRTDIAVIGAGLAGAACARALARAGFRVTVFEAAAEPATGASGNPIGILHPLVSRDHNLASQLVELGMAKTLEWLELVNPIALSKGMGPVGKSCGVLQLNESGDDLVQWDPKGAWIKPRRFVETCLVDAQAHGARVHFERPIAELTDDGALIFQDCISRKFDAVVVCNASQMESLLPSCELALNAIRGTVSRYQVSVQDSLPCVICASGYATPVVEGEMVVGASYERLPAVVGEAGPRLGIDATVSGGESPREVSGHDDAVSNLDRLSIIDSRLAAICAGLPARDRTSIRSATLDRMPHVGRVLDTRVMLKPSVSQLHQMPRNERIWVLGGLGSRGLSFAPLGAEIIAAQMAGQPLPISDRLAGAIDPVRFALRRHQRRK